VTDSPTPQEVRHALARAEHGAALDVGQATALLSATGEQLDALWLGVEGTRARLNASANDVGGTLVEETISRMAGFEHGSAKTVAELIDIAPGIDRPDVERNTTYRVSTRPVIASRI